MLCGTLIRSLALILSLLHHLPTASFSANFMTRGFEIEIRPSLSSAVTTLAAPFHPTCESSASIALRKWRRDCDRSPYQKIKSHCWGRAPSVQKCCPRSQSKTKSCKAFWPKNKHEEHECHVEQEGYCNLLEQDGEQCVSEARCARMVGDATFCFCKIPGCLACTGK